MRLVTRLPSLLDALLLQAVEIADQIVPFDGDRWNEGCGELSPSVGGLRGDRIIVGHAVFSPIDSPNCKRIQVATAGNSRSDFSSLPFDLNS